MAIRADSYGTTDEVAAYVRHLLAGAGSFNASTRPTLADVEKFIDRASGALNMGLRKAGFAPSAVRANSTAKLAMDDWVVSRAAMYCELTQRGTGYSGEENSRTGAFRGLYEDAVEFSDSIALSLKREGVSVADPAHQGLTFTADDEHTERTDPDSSTREQPVFRRRLWDND